MSKLKLTAIYEKAQEGGYVGHVAEFPGANTQGETLEETRENLLDALKELFLEQSQNELNQLEFEENSFVQETLVFSLIKYESE